MMQLIFVYKLIQLAQQLMQILELSKCLKMLLTISIFIELIILPVKQHYQKHCRNLQLKLNYL
ncbi:MAG: hypothetical protein CL489_05895 [Acidobacteria bacterium]|nr:hypothetical protein [Acidobacteriota bacterium]